MIVEMLCNANIEEVELLDLNNLKLNYLNEIDISKYFNFKVQKLKLDKWNWKYINNILIKNISKFNPSFLYLPEFGQNTNPFEIMLNLSDNVTVNHRYFVSNSYTLKFSNVFLIEEKEYSIKLHWREIKFDFYYLKPDNIIITNNNLIISNFEYVEIFDLTKEIIIPESASENVSFISSENGNYFVLPQSKLTEITLGVGDIRTLLKSDKNLANLSSISFTTKVVISLFDMVDIREFYKISEYVPNHSVLDLTLYIYSWLNIVYNDIQL